MADGVRHNVIRLRLLMAQAILCLRTDKHAFFRAALFRSLGGRFDSNAIIQMCDDTDEPGARPVAAAGGVSNDEVGGNNSLAFGLIAGSGRPYSSSACSCNR